MIWKPKENKVTSEEIAYIFFSIISLGSRDSSSKHSFRGIFMALSIPPSWKHLITFCPLSFMCYGILLDPLSSIWRLCLKKNFPRF